MLLPSPREHGVSTSRDCPELECDRHFYTLRRLGFIGRVPIVRVLRQKGNEYAVQGDRQDFFHRE